MLPEKLKNILREMKEEAKSDLVFTDSKAELIKYNAIQSSFNAGFAALNLPWRSTHICRHTYATIALMDDKKSFCCSNQPWIYRNKNDSKVCKDCCSFESRNGGKNFFRSF